MGAALLTFYANKEGVALEAQKKAHSPQPKCFSSFCIFLRNSCKTDLMHMIKSREAMKNTTKF
uniref:Uncharacterized protein n=1 Tax=Romanomermis culicivorax TaxID=13658 RepID=A0A915HKP7_ROMCU